MAKRIDLSFFTSPPTAPSSAEKGKGGANVNEDTVERSSEIREKNLAKLESLQMGQHTVAEVVKGLEKVLGHELYPSEIVEMQSGGGITKVFFEPRLPTPPKPEPQVKKANTICDITDGGSVNSSMARAGLGIDHRLEDHMFVKFQTKFTKAPSVIVGINHLHENRSENIRITGTPENVQTHLFEVHGRAWGNTTVFASGFTWLAIPSYDNPLLQTGTFSTYDDHKWDVKKDITHKVISFKTPYKSTPKVVVWLRQIESKREFNDRVMAFATDITRTEFKVNVNSWGDSFLHGAVISWFAYPADTLGINSGDLQPTNGTVGVVKFDKPFAKPPRRVLVALNKIETEKGLDCRFKIFHEAVTEMGMAIRVETWGNSKIHTAGVAYIAME